MKIVKLLIFSSVLLSATAYAQLGGDESTVEVVRSHVHGVHIQRMQQTTRVHEISSAGNTIREYANDDGKIFAVTWSGISHPDLSVLFGDYHAEYQEGDQSTRAPAGRAPKFVQTQNLRAVHFGHMRDVHGKAIIPSLAPPGFDLKDLQ